MRIAIVDDDRAVRKAMRRLLMASDFEVDDYASGRELLAGLDHPRVDCVIADLKTPDLGGVELLSAFLARGSRVPIIIMTAFDTPQSRTECERLGASAYLCKPVSERTLLSAIEAAVAAAGGTKKKDNRSSPSHD
jgi:FixJ family two-component response regulator